MSKTNSNDFYGMRIIWQMDNIVGLLWALEGEKIVLYFYYRDECNNYLCDRLEDLSLKSTCKGGSVNDAFSYLRQVSNRAKPSYKIYMTRECAKAIEEQYTL